jgi:hypothetical protein
MFARRHPAAADVAGVVLVVVLIASCSSQPVSEATDRPSVATSVEAGSGEAPSVPPSSSPASQSSPPSAPSSTPVPADAPPPKPGNPTFKLVKETANGTGGFSDEYRITWTSPRDVADSFRVYGLPECLRNAKKYDGKPCVVRGMRIPADHLDLLATAPGDARSVDVKWDIGETGPPPYSAVLIRATNSAGDSIFTIVHSENVCFGCTY